MNASNTIVAALGRFPQDDAVLARAVELARHFGSTLMVAHFVGQINGWNLPASEKEDIERQVMLVAKERIKAALSRYADTGLDIQIHIDSGSPGIRLIALSEEIDVGLFVMGANQSDSIIDKVLGSTTDRVIRAAGVSVLVVTQQIEDSYGHVLIGVDTADESGEFFDVAAAWFPHAEFELVHVAQVPAQFEEAMLRAGSSQATIIGYRDALIHKAQAYLRTLCEPLNNDVARFTARVMTGDPTTVLVRLSRHCDTELVVLEPGKTSRIRQALLGSVARRVLREALCDVLIYRSPKKKGTGEKESVRQDGGGN